MTRRRLPAWLALVAIAPILAGWYLGLPAGNPRLIVYPLFGLAAFAVIIGAVVRNAPARWRWWGSIAVGLGLISIGDITYTVLAVNLPEMPYPSPADAGYLSGYVFLLAGMLGLLRGRTAARDRTGLIDAAIATAGASSLFWVAIILPSITGATDPLSIGVSLAYPIADLVVVMVGVRALLSGAVTSRYLQLLMAGLGLYFTASVVYAMALLDGTYASGHPVDAGWIVGIVLMAAAALHPSARDAVAPIALKEARLSRSRLAILAVAAMLAPASLIIEFANGNDTAVAGLVLSWTVLFGLVLVRLATTVDELGDSLLHRRRLQDDLAYQATHDPLTRLANRTLFERRLNGALAADPAGTALIFLDLDDFKAVNDALGHATGDALLQTIASRLQRELRPGDLAARLGGDEFAVLIAECPDEPTVRAIAERILGAIRTPIALAGRQMVAHASAGIAFGVAGATGMGMMRDADVAMYQAKSNGKDQIEEHEPAMHEAIVRSHQLRTELAAAIEANAFVLEYQPAVEIESGVIIGAEALVRWRHAERGILPPSEFIAIAESSGLIHGLGRWILREACTAAAAWPARPDGRSRRVSVNLAPAQLLQPRLVDDVAEALRATGLEPDRLILEVTESALTDLVAAKTALGKLHAIGVQLALDDFGTGYSALSYLADLPFDVVKIDQGFVAGLEDDQRVEALLGGILGLCRALDLHAIAEGIETEPQLARLRRLGCKYGQGYLYARPMPVRDLEAAFVSSDTRSTVPGHRPVIRRALVETGR